MAVPANEVVERVGNFTMTVHPVEDTPESRKRRDGRVDALAVWLLAEWQRDPRRGPRLIGSAERAGRDEEGSQ